MEKLQKRSNPRLRKVLKVDIMFRRSRRNWFSTIHRVNFVCLCIIAASSPRSCTSSTAQAAVVAPAKAPAPAPASIGNPTDPGQMATFYSMHVWPEVWRQHGTKPNISDTTITTRDICMNNESWVGVHCDGGSPYQSIIQIYVPDMEGGYPDNFLQVISNLTTLQSLYIYQKGDAATSSLGGSIPASLGQLIHLKDLNFRGNQLVGPVPPEVARLPKLTSINLADNQLTGSIDQFCESKSLQILQLFDNHFSQDLPACLGSMNLTRLSLGANNFTGSIPESFAKLVNLQFLNIDNTTLTGGLPNYLVSAWQQLTYLSFLRSNLSGPIPDAIGNLKHLTNVQLGMNQFSGAIPPSLGMLDSLTSLSLYNNRLTGEIPVEIGGLTNLTTLLLYNNSLSGSLPSTLGRLSNLQHLHLQGNNFSGGINGSMFANWAGLKGLFLQENNFSGTFPSNDLFNSCMSLVNVSLSYNSFKGPVLEPNTTLPSNLSLLLMSYNEFSGPIPSAMGLSSSLQFLDLANNSLTGNVPAEVTNKATRGNVQINLSFNSLNVSDHDVSHPGFGLFTCHPQDANCTEYHAGTNEGVAINVGGLALQGFEADVVTVDNSVGMFKASPSASWSLSTTGVDGGFRLNRTQAPANVDTLPKWLLYTTARTGGDSFTYYIYGLHASTKYKVALGFVELVADLRIGERVFDIWIQGRLRVQGMDVMARAPGQFRAFVETLEAETMDQGLLTIELRGHGSWPLAFNKRFKQGQYYGPILSSLRVYREKELSHVAKIYIIASSTGGGLLFALAFLLLGVIVFKRRRKLQAMKDEHAGLGLTFFRYSELEAATCKWSAKSLIGVGAFGKVYRGILADGTTVAIKQLVVKSDGPLWTKKAFLNEAKIISSTRHRNLIALLGCCLETSNPMFICEYMPNGSLHDALFVHKLPLSWPQRVAIAKDVASGLLYLHEETVNRIVHRDVKPANILLDEKMNARVADFGLARLVGDQEIDVITNVMGTRGYLAPEYALNGQLSDKVDVYSFGVVLLELVSGRHGLQPSRDVPNPEPISIVQWTWDMVSDGLVLGVADPQLYHAYDFCNEDFICIVEIALWCTQSHPQMRPSMNQANCEQLVAKRTEVYALGNGSVYGQVARMLLKQARVPKLTTNKRTLYEIRDIRQLPVNPFDEGQWPCYTVDVPSSKDAKDAKDATSFSTVINQPHNSFNFESEAVLPQSGLLPR